MNGSAEGFADYSVVIDPDRNWLASVMERAQRTINILPGAWMEGEKWPGEKGNGGGWSQISRQTKTSRDPVATNPFDNSAISFPIAYNSTLHFYKFPMPNLLL